MVIRTFIPDCVSIHSIASSDDDLFKSHLLKERSRKSDCSDSCYSCGVFITDRYLLTVNGRVWHSDCLRCTICMELLDSAQTCFIRHNRVYCKHDYNKEFGTKCSKCLRNIQSTDWVRRARDHVYHLACFSCDNCKRQLSTGEEFALKDGRIMCKTHYVELIEGGCGTDDESASAKAKSKRVRTTFSEEQLQVLQANFQLDSNPDGQDLERIAQITGLSKRVTQVWFQNSRARQKKHQYIGPNGTLITGSLMNHDQLVSTASISNTFQTSITMQHDMHSVDSESPDTSDIYRAAGSEFEYEDSMSS